MLGLALALAGAGCSGGGSSEETAAVPQARVELSAALRGGAAPAVAQMQSLLGSAPIGSPVSFVAESGLDTVYGLGADGQILLAGTASGGVVELSARSTVRELLRSLVNAERPQADLAAIDAAVEQVLAGTALVSSFERLYVAGSDPLTDRTFVEDLAALSRAASQRLGSVASSRRERALLLPGLRPAPEPVVRYPSAVVLVNDEVGVSDASATVVVHDNPDRSFSLASASPVAWAVRIADVQGAEKQRFLAEPAAFHQVLTGVATEWPIARGGNGSFAVELTADNQANGLLFLKGLLDIAAPGFKPRVSKADGSPSELLEYSLACQKSLQGLAGDLLDQSIKAEGPNGGMAYFQALVKKTPGVLRACIALPKEAQGNPVIEDLQVADLVAKKLGWVGKVYAASAVGAQAGLWARHMDKPVSAGICVSDAGFLQSCVARMEAGSAPPPLSVGEALYPSANKSAQVRFINARGLPTAMPAELAVRFEPPSLADSVEFIPLGFLPSEGLSFLLKSKFTAGQGDVVLSDPATGTQARIPVRVSTGRFDPARLTVRVGETVELTLKDLVSDQALLPSVARSQVAVSGADAVDFQYGQANGEGKVRVTGKAAGSAGRFELSVLGGPLVAALDVEVIPAEIYWTLSYRITGCTPASMPFGWAFTAPCYAYLPGGAWPFEANYQIHFDDISDTVLLDGRGRLGVPLGWRSTDTVRSYQTSYPLPLAFGPTTATWRFIEESAQADGIGLVSARGRLEATMTSGYYTTVLTRFERGGVEIIDTTAIGTWTLTRHQGRRPVAPITNPAQTWCASSNIGSDGQPCIYSPP